jgi:hypothetical protein
LNLNLYCLSHDNPKRNIINIVTYLATVATVDGGWIGKCIYWSVVTSVSKEVAATILKVKVTLKIGAAAFSSDVQINYTNRRQQHT